MKSYQTDPTTGALPPSLSLSEYIHSLALSAFTWLVAMLFTLCSILFRVIFFTIDTVVRYVLKWSVYLLLGTLFICGALILAALSLITLKALSLP